MIYLTGMFRTSSLGGSISSDSGRTAPRKWGGARLQRISQQRAGPLNIKRWLLIKENQISQVKEFSNFLHIGRCKSLAAQPSGASILCFLILSLLRVYHWSGCSVWWSDGRHPASILSSLRAHCCGSCNVMAKWLQHPLFTNIVIQSKLILLTAQ